MIQASLAHFPWLPDKLNPAWREMRRASGLVWLGVALSLHETNLLSEQAAKGTFC